MKHAIEPAVRQPHATGVIGPSGAPCAPDAA
jgi:hypothetical protein